MTVTDHAISPRLSPATCRKLGLRHIRTKPYTPRTNGKAERVIQTALREWAHVMAYPTSQHRAAELPIWLHRYNWYRPHGSLKAKPPIKPPRLETGQSLKTHLKGQPNPRACIGPFATKSASPPTNELTPTDEEKRERSFGLLTRLQITERIPSKEIGLVTRRPLCRGLTEVDICTLAIDDNFQGKGPQTR